MKHADLVDYATRIFGGQLLHELAYETFRARLFALYKATWGHLPQAERFQEALRNVYLMRATQGHPWWEQVGAEIEEALERL